MTKVGGRTCSASVIRHSSFVSLEERCSMPISNRKQVIILSFALVGVSLGFGMVIPIFPFYIERMGGGGKELGLLVAVAALTELIFGPVWGSLSDRVGRKPILMLGMGGEGCC